MTFKTVYLVSEMLRIHTGSEFQANGPVTENAHSPSLVKVYWTVQMRVSVENVVLVGEMMQQ